MDAKFEQFLQERQYLYNVSPNTLLWYRQSFQWLGNVEPTDCDLTDFVIRMRQAGLKPSSCNNRIRAINAYLRWSGSKLKVKKLKEPVRVLPTFSADDIRKIALWKPKASSQRRTQLLILTLTDTGCRVSELLTLKWKCVDFDNLLVTVVGKGDKQRVVPFSLELRKFLFKYKQQSQHESVFCTRNGLSLSVRNVHHEVSRLLHALNITAPERMLHALRHTFATNYIRTGGNVLYLQRVLGHSSLEMTKRYVTLQTQDLSRVHQQRSLLSAL